MKTTPIAFLLLALLAGWTHHFDLVDYAAIALAWLSAAWVWFRVGIRTMEQRFLCEVGDIIQAYRSNEPQTPE
jgi:Na+/H+ antiporter NhaD/arsenite permease-like protein